MLPTIATGNVGSALAGEYEVANSLRFDDGSSDHLFFGSTGTDGNRKSWTLSLWFKRANLGSTQTLFSSGKSHILEGFVRINSSDRLEFKNDGQYGGEASPTRVLRDTSAWYHLVWSVDSTQASNDDRWKIYLNGELIPASEYSSVAITSNGDGNILTFSGTYASDLAIGRRERTDADYWDGYIAEAVLVEGSQLDPTSFGEFDSDTNIWKPIDVSGLTFGTNGFYLDFENSGSLGADVSGNGNNFTVNNLTSIDQSTDTCTNNFTTWNPLDSARTYSGTIDLKHGNLTQDNANDASLISTIALNKGKWYMEFKCEDADNTRTFGIIDIAESNGYVGHPSIASAVSYGYKSSDGTLWIGTSQQASSVGTTSAGDIVSIALDLDSSTKTIKWQKNGSDLSGTTQLTITHSTATYYFGIYCRCDGGQIISANFGSPPYSISSGNSDAEGFGNFEYSVPSGYFSLCTKNLAEYG